MSELNFLVFCITVIALTAIVYGKDKVAEKALSALSRTAGGFISALEKGFWQGKLGNSSNTQKNTGKSLQRERKKTA
jgi:hypothetical protein